MFILILCGWVFFPVWIYVQPVHPWYPQALVMCLRSGESTGSSWTGVTMVVSHQVAFGTEFRSPLRIASQCSSSLSRLSCLHNLLLISPRISSDGGCVLRNYDVKWEGRKCTQVHSRGLPCGDLKEVQTELIELYRLELRMAASPLFRKTLQPLLWQCTLKMPEDSNGLFLVELLKSWILY